MTIFILKALIAPICIGTVTMAGRCWGPVVSGFLVGLPLTSGPASVILAHEFGLEFAAKAAVGSLAGQFSNCAFCLAYSFTSKKYGWRVSVGIGLAVYLLSTLAWSSFSWHLIPALIVLLAFSVLAASLIPNHQMPLSMSIPPSWDLPARMAVATIFVISVTTFASMLGSQLSGVLSAFPVFGIVLAAFTQSQQGAAAASNLLRGIVIGSFAYSAFFLMVGLLIVGFGIALTYSIAILSATLVGFLSYLVSRNERFSNQSNKLNLFQKMSY